MKVIFLDFDGTILPMGKASLNDKAVGKAVNHFKTIMKEVPGVKIVISSAWRKHGIGYCKRFLDGLGIDPEAVVGITGHERTSRGQQIQLYLNRNTEVKQFVILDDVSDMDHLLNKLVHISPLIGVTEADAKRAVEILNE